MNHPDLSQLDPKLQETYNRVMGTDVSSIPQTPASQPIPQTPAQTAASVQSPEPTPQQIPTLVNNSEKETVFTSPTISATGQHAGIFTRKKKDSVSMPIIVAGGLAAAIAYAVLWMKVFGIF